MEDSEDSFKRAPKSNSISETVYWKNIVGLSMPAIVCYVMVILQELINLVIVGMLDDERLLAAVGLGNTIINIIGVGMYYGLNSALSTYVS